MTATIQANFSQGRALSEASAQRIGFGSDKKLAVLFKFAEI
jgi:hypothetical protein